MTMTLTADIVMAIGELKNIRGGTSIKMAIKWMKRHL